jgi:REP element-mobilizing transposase RayT
MARPLRIEYPEAWYHVTSRGNARQDIFRNDRDRGKFLEILEKSANLYDVEIHAYVLMRNHFHLLLMTREANLSRFMQHFNTSYTVYYNRRHDRSGHLYQGRYKAILVEADSYLMELSRYLHLNPVRVKKYSKLGIKEKRNIVNNYLWSSYRGYVRLKERHPFIHYCKIIEMIGGKDDVKSRQRYRSFVMSGIQKEMDLSFWNEVKGQSILGSDSFTDWAYERFILKEKKDNVEIQGIKPLRKAAITMEKISSTVAREFRVSEEDLYRKRSSFREARSIFIELCRLYLSRDMKLAELGQDLGNISVVAFSQNRKRTEERLEKNSQLREKFQKIKSSLSKK